MHQFRQGLAKDLGRVLVKVYAWIQARVWSRCQALGFGHFNISRVCSLVDLFGTEYYCFFCTEILVRYMKGFRYGFGQGFKHGFKKGFGQRFVYGSEHRLGQWFGHWDPGNVITVGLRQGLDQMWV